MSNDDESAGMEYARERVANGVKVLDDKVPGWWKVINLDTLEMGNCHTCMLGQLFGFEAELAVGAAMFGLPTTVTPDIECPMVAGKVRIEEAGYFRGLDILKTGTGSDIGCNEDYVDDDVHIGFDDLKCAWAEVIATRRAAEPDVTEVSNDQ